MANTTWNPADISGATLSGGNLIATAGGGTGGVRSIASQTSGKFYWEQTYTTLNSNTITCGMALATASLTTPQTGTTTIQRTTGNIVINNTSSGSSISGGTAIAAGSVICFSVDFTAQLLWVRRGAAGTWNGSGTANPATAAGGLSITSIAGSLFALMSGQGGDVVTANFGDSAFTGAVPSGFTSGFPAAAAAAGPMVTWIF